MAFKMKGFPKHMHGSPMKTGHDKLLKSENPDTHVYKGDDMGEKINDLEDRIEFIKEDIFNQDGKATEQQKKDIATLQAMLKKLRAKK